MEKAMQLQLEAQVLPPFLPPSEMRMTGYFALHRSAAWRDLSNRAKIAVRGPGRVRFVDGLVSNDVRGLQSGDSCYAFFLNQEGYVLGDAHVVCLRKEILIDTEPELQVKLVRHMERNTIPSGVRVEDVTDRVSTLSVEGPHAPEVVARAGFPVPGCQHEFLEIPHGWIGRLNTTGQDGFFFFVPSMWKSELISQIGAAGAVQASGEEMRIVRIERGKPRYGEEITSQYFAQETGLCHALDFQKGPYLGRGTVQDIHSHGRLNRLLVSVEIDSAELIRPCASLSFAGSQCGQLVSTVYSPAYQKVVGLAYVRPDLASAGVELLSLDAMRIRVKRRINTGITSCDFHN